MGVTYKLTDEVIHFIISQRQSNPLSSCRQLAESASQKFGLRLSKSSVHDVLKESGIITPRGRKPKEKFEIPQEKKKQIQVSLSQVKLIAPPVAEVSLIADVVVENDHPVIVSEAKDPKAPLDSSALPQNDEKKEEMEISAEYEGAGRIFLKAALWDLGIFSEENIKATDWSYYLTYCKGIKVVLEKNKDFFIDLPLPIERCIKEAADGLINNVKPLVIYKVSDEALFKACMDAQPGFKINNISIVGKNDHILFELCNIMEIKRRFIEQNIVFVENDEINILERSKIIFFSQNVNTSDTIDNIMSLKGFDATNKNENVVTLLIEDGYNNKILLQEAVEKLNGMYLRDEQDRLVKVKIQTVISNEVKDIKASSDPSATLQNDSDVSQENF